jgi:hypothetical protein
MIRWDSMMAIGAIASDVLPHEAGAAMPNLTGRSPLALCMRVHPNCFASSLRRPHAVIGNSWLLFRATDSLTWRR